MPNPLVAKIGFILLITFVLMIAIFTVSGTVTDRKHYRDSAKASVAQSWTGTQEIFGPVLVVPYQISWTQEVFSSSGLNKLVQQKQSKGVKYVMASQLNQAVSLTTELRSKGIFEIPVYTSKIDVSGEFVLHELDQVSTSHIDGQDITVTFESPYLGFGIRDGRGISSSGKLQFADDSVEFQAGSGLNYLNTGLHARLPFSPDQFSERTTMPFHFTLGLRGLDELLTHPVAKNFQMDMSGNWAHPSFVGNFLPSVYTVSETGFEAHWAVTEFASNFREILGQCARSTCGLSSSLATGVKLVQPVDIYSQTERSLKYALLFIALVFVAFFVFEILRGLPIHPVQYGLVGSAIAVFYLLLIALSEHFNFFLSYALAALACVLLISTYLVFVLKSRVTATLFGGLLVLIYSTLYVIVSLEDYALLMGTAVVFIVLAVAMLATRHVDWYQLEIKNPLEMARRDIKTVDSDDEDKSDSIR